MKRVFPSLLVLLGVLLWFTPLISQTTIPGIAPGPVAWAEMARFLPSSFGRFKAASAAEGGRLDEEEMSLSWASRKYDLGQSGEEMEITIVDTVGAGESLAEFRRLRLGREDSQVRSVAPTKIGKCPAVQVRYHQESKAEVLILVAERFLAHVIVSELSGRREFAAAREAALKLDLKGLAGLVAGAPARD